MRSKPPFLRCAAALGLRELQDVRLGITLCRKAPVLKRCRPRRSHALPTSMSDRLRPADEVDLQDAFAVLLTSAIQSSVRFT